MNSVHILPPISLAYILQAKLPHLALPFDQHMLLVHAVALFMILFVVMMKFFEATRRVLSSVLGSNATRFIAVLVRLLHCCVCVCVCRVL